MQLAAIHDVISICTLWVMCLYSGFASIYNITLNMMKTLIGLFRGKKYNVMRERYDANEFQVEELYIGVLVFTLIIFLLPTVAIFYFYVFISIILRILAYQLLLILLQTCVCEFPYYLLPLVNVRPYTLSRSIRMESEPLNNNAIKLISLPMEKGQIFNNLKNELKIVVNMKTFVNIFKSVMSGQNLYDNIIRGFLHNLASVRPEDTALVKDYEES